MVVSRQEVTLHNPVYAFSLICAIWGCSNPLLALNLLRRFFHKLSAVGSMDEPGIDVLAHSGQHDAKEPPVTSSGARLREKEVTLFAFDRAFGTGACILVALPESTLSGDEGVQAVVLLGIGIDDAAIR